MDMNTGPFEQNVRSLLDTKTRLAGGDKTDPFAD